MPTTEVLGHVFGRLTVIEIIEQLGPGGRRYVRCQCTCGTVKDIMVQSLRAGLTVSCGCFMRERAAKQKPNLTHGLTGTRVYRVWRNMHSRCENPNVPCYEHYGARGITVCKRWFKFENFLADMGPPPSPGHSIDRIDWTGNYSPKNCRWATDAEQARNRSDNILLTFDGKTMTAWDWAAELGIGPSTVYWRLKRGWSAERTLTAPIRKCSHNRKAQ